MGIFPPVDLDVMMIKGTIKHFFYGCWPADSVGFNGNSLTATCAHCGNRILQDSWGQWFSVGPINE